MTNKEAGHVIYCTSQLTGLGVFGLQLPVLLPAVEALKLKPDNVTTLHLIMVVPAVQTLILTIQKPRTATHIPALLMENGAIGVHFQLVQYLVEEEHTQGQG